MEHYCMQCGGHFRDAKFDHDYGRCNKCSKSQRKRDNKRNAVFREYADVEVGDLMDWHGYMCIVTEVLPDKGWRVFIPSVGHNETVYVFSDETLETFSERLRRYRPNNETDKK